MQDIAKLISDGSDTFLRTEYRSMSVFVTIFAVAIAFVAEPEIGTFWTTGAFIVGALTSVLSGYIGMWISVRANIRTTK